MFHLYTKHKGNLYLKENKYKLRRFEIWYKVPICKNICSLDVKINSTLTLVGQMLPMLYYYSGKDEASGNKFPVFYNVPELGFTELGSY